MRHGAQQAAVNQSTNDNYKIIVVDDEEGILDSLSIFLKRSGYQFVGITDPVEAIERVKQEHFDLLVLDFIMTPLHGDQVVEEIRKFNKELYILLLTGHKDLAPPLETIKRLDIQGYCEKSDKFDQVILLIESGIKSVAQMREIQRINEELKDTYEQLEKAYLESVQTIRYTVEAKDPYTRGHSDRVSAYSVLIGEKLGLSEKDLKNAIIKNLKYFILEVGKDFTFIGDEYRVQVGNHDFFIDLLFYNRELSCLVAFELKLGEFKAEYLGKMNLYLEALDRDVKKEQENPSVGVILCSSKDEDVVEYSISKNMS